MVGGEDQLDQYLMRNPSDFFEAPPEDAICDPENGQLSRTCRLCGRRELALPADERFFGETFPGVVADLTDEGIFDRREVADGIRWTHAGSSSPQQAVSLRTAGDREIDLIDSSRNETVASLGFGDALRDAHPGAIYHQQGPNLRGHESRPRPRCGRTAVVVGRLLHPAAHREGHRRERGSGERELSARPDVPVRFADVTVTEQITGFVRKDTATGESLGSQCWISRDDAADEGAVLPGSGDIESEMRALGARDADADGTNEAARRRRHGGGDRRRRRSVGR